MSFVYTGEAKELNNASSGVVQTFAFALLVVVLVLAAQFESFVSAIILMATVPFGLAAAMFAMLLTGGSLNIYSQIGLVMLVGLMSKNGILIVEFANQLRDQGQSVREAIRNAALIRLRPVVMTMIATVLGGLPLLLTRRRRRRGAPRARLDHRRRPRLRDDRNAVPHAGRVQPARRLLQAAHRRGAAPDPRTGRSGGAPALVETDRRGIRRAGDSRGRGIGLRPRRRGMPARLKIVLPDGTPF